MSGTTGDFGNPGFSRLNIQGTGLGTALTQIFESDDIEPGTAPSYQICRAIFLYHPLGQKMVEAPLNMAQAEKRDVLVPSAPERVVKAFLTTAKEIKEDAIVHNICRLARIYGIASLGVGEKGKKSSEPLNFKNLASATLFFKTLDPLNTAGSLVLNQNPEADDFQTPTHITVQGVQYHASRMCVIMHEEPIYIAYTSAAFGFVGRSVYQRALYPLKSFIGTMRTDDMIARKAGLLIAMMKAPGSIINRVMGAISGFKRALLQEGETNNVLSIDVEEKIESLNLQNIDGAGTFARNNILKNCATAADMPAKLLENETLVQGFGEGTEDAKNIARYIDRVREWMDAVYQFLDVIVQHKAWNPDFYAQLQKDLPEAYGKMPYETAFSQWQNAFEAKWPSMLKEPDSERVKTEDVKMRAIVAVIEAFGAELDPLNKAHLIQWAQQNLNDTELLFSVDLKLDIDAIIENLEERAEQEKAMQQPPASDEGGGDAAGGAKKPAPFSLSRAA